MSIVIFGIGINGKSGIDKAAVYGANLFAMNGYDTHIYTFSEDVIGGRKFAAGQHFRLFDSVKSFSLLDYNIIEKNKVEFKNIVVKRIEHQFLKMNITKYHLAALKEICEKLDENDTIIFTNPICSLTYKLADVQSKAFKIVQIHSDYEYDFENREHLLNSFTEVDLIQPVSKGMIPYLRKITNDEVQVKEIYNVVSMKKEAKKIVSNNSEKYRISIIGSIQERKNQLAAIQMMSYLPENYELNIYGGMYGEYFEFLLKEVENNNLVKKVNFKGIKTQEEIFKETDVVISTSKAEGFGYTLAEALLNGLPIVSFNYRYGADEIVINSENGYLIENENIEEMAKKIQDICEGNDFNKFRENARQSYNLKFTNEQVLKMYSPFIKKTKEKKIHSELEKKKIEYFTVDTKVQKKWRTLQMAIVISGEENFFENETILKVKYIKENKVKELDFEIVDNKIIANLEGREIDRLYVLTIETQTSEFYVLNINYNKRKELIARNYSYEITGLDKNSYNQYDGQLIFPVLFAERIVKISNGADIEYDYIFIRNIGFEGIYFETISVFDVFDQKIFVHLQDEQIREINLNKTIEKTYDYIWNRLIEYEEKKGVLDVEVNDVFIWELIKAPMIINWMKKNSLWTEPNHEKENYALDLQLKKINYIENTSKTKLKLIYNVSTNYEIYAPFIDEETIIHVTNLESYVHYYNQFGKNVGYIHFEKVDINNELQINEDMIDNIAAFFAEAFEIENFQMKNEIKVRYEKFLKTYKFYSEFFKNSNFDELIIVSGIWDQGIIKAAKENGIIVSELQYAFISNNHLNYGMTANRQYVPDNIYVWNEYWRKKSGFAIRESVIEEKYDFAIISQHLLTRYTIKIANELSKHFPNDKIVILLHPAEKINKTLLRSSTIEIKYGQTKNISKNSEFVLGFFSTALFEMDNLNKVFVVETPGFEMTFQEKQFNQIRIKDLRKIKGKLWNFSRWRKIISMEFENYLIIHFLKKRNIYLFIKKLDE
ncbi:MAG: glycosyltransferase [Mycoplasmatales bacterium]